MRQTVTPTDKPSARRPAYKLLGLTLILLGLALALPAGAAAFISTGGGDATWSKQSAPSPATLNAVAFPDAVHGWAVGLGGAILATTNGGATWSEQSSGVIVDLKGVAFPDATHGWAVGLGGAILATANGGVTWSEQSSGVTVDLKSVSFVDAAHGWAVGSEFAYVVDPNLPGVGVPIYEEVILATANGGATWSAKSLAPGVFYGFTGVAFSDGAHGWIVGDFNSNQDRVVLATKDSGTTWRKQTYSPPPGTVAVSHLQAVAFSDATYGWAVGLGSAILATTNGGATWTEQKMPVSTWLYGVAFPDAVHGWAVGLGGAILATSNAGYTWSLQRYESGSRLYGVAFPDAVHGWAVGDGVILATLDGGVAWSKQYPKSPVPTVANLKPASAKRGALITITGANFGAKGSTSTVRFGSKTCTTYVSWSPTQITCNVPTNAKYGKVSVTVATFAGTSKARNFTVKR